jgi:hypothetical protein
MARRSKVHPPVRDATLEALAHQVWPRSFPGTATSLLGGWATPPWLIPNPDCGGWKAWSGRFLAGLLQPPPSALALVGVVENPYCPGRPASQDRPVTHHQYPVTRRLLSSPSEPSLTCRCSRLTRVGSFSTFLDGFRPCRSRAASLVNVLPAGSPPGWRGSLSDHPHSPPPPRRSSTCPPGRGASPAAALLPPDAPAGPLLSERPRAG